MLLTTGEIIMLPYTVTDFVMLIFLEVPLIVLDAVHRTFLTPSSVIDNVAPWTLLPDCVSVQVKEAGGYATAEHVRVEPKSDELSGLYPAIVMLDGEPYKQQNHMR